MTVIKIEKKKNLGIWVILGLMMVAVLLYWYFSSQFNKAEVVETTSSIEQTTKIEENNAVANYISFIDDDTNKMGLDHEFTNKAFLKLTNAIEAKANDGGYDLKVDLSSARVFANKITDDPYDTTHASSIRKAADILTNSMVNLQQATYPTLTAEASQIKSAAAAINPDVLTLEQKDAVKTFFRKASDLLNKMN